MDLKQYIEEQILPMYDGFDAAHRRDHAELVIRQSLQISEQMDVDLQMVYAIAAYHDTGLVKDRATHHLVSGQIVRDDARLAEWFTPEQIETMAQAVEDHRASTDHEPRSIYGKIVSEADRYIDPHKVIERAVQYGLTNYPELDREGQWQRARRHLLNKYGDGGYLKLWFPQSPNVARLQRLRDILRDEQQLRAIFDSVYNGLV